MTFLASQPSESMATEMTFCTHCPTVPRLPTLSTMARSSASFFSTRSEALDAVQPLDPARRLIEIKPQCVGLLAADLEFGRFAIGVVGLVVDDDQIAAVGQGAEHALDEGGVAFRALLDHRALLGLERHQVVPVLDRQLDPVELLAQGFVRAEREGVVIVVGMTGAQHLEPFLDRQPGVTMKTACEKSRRRLG